MVHKPRDGDNRRPTRPKPHGRAETSPRAAPQKFSLATLDSRNYFADHPSKATNSVRYHFYLIDRDWICELRKCTEKRIRFTPDPPNEALFRQNIYAVPEVNLTPGSQWILKNDLVVNYELEILTEDAWAYIHSFFSGFPVTCSFQVDDSGQWSEAMRFMSFNLVFLGPEGPPVTCLFQTNETRYVSMLLSHVGDHYKLDESCLEIAQLDTRLSLNDLLACLDQGEVPGRTFDREATFPFKYLKDHDILLVYEKSRAKVVEPPRKTRGFCAKCRRADDLIFSCACNINAYCTIDCRCSDFLQHRFLCKEYRYFDEDVATDLAPISGQPDRGLSTGLINIGNSCYINGLLQVLKMVPAVRHQLINAPLPSDTKSLFLLGFYHAMVKMLRFPGPSIRPWPLKLSLGLLSNQFLNNSQHDSSEALDFMLNDLDSSKMPLFKAVSDSFKGTTVGQFQCRDCQKIQVRDVEDPFFLFQVPLVQEPPAKEFVVAISNEDETGFKCSDLRVGLKEGEFTLKHLAAIATNTAVPPHFLVTAMRKDVLTPLQTDEEFTNFVFEKRLKADAPLDVGLQVLSAPPGRFLSVSVSQVFLIGGKHKQFKTLISPKLLPVDDALLTPDGTITHLALHMRVFRTLKPHLFAVFPEVAKVYRELAQKEYPRADEAFYVALTQNIVPNPSPLPSPKSSPKPSEDDTIAKPQETDEEYFAKLVKDVRYAIAQTGELKNEKLFTLNFTHAGYKCENCGVLGGAGCPFAPAADRVASFPPVPLPPAHPHSHPHPHLQFIRVTVELSDYSKIAKHFQTLHEAEASKQLRPGQVDRQSFYLKTAFDSVFAWEPIERKCEGCGSNASSMQTSICHFPDYMILHLKRFKQEYDRYGNLKAVKRDDYLHYDFETTIAGRPYALCGVVNHVGNLNDGHYTCAIFDEDQNAWLEFNDETVTRLRDREDIRSKANYILFFKALPTSN